MFYFVKNIYDKPSIEKTKLVNKQKLLNINDICL